MPGTRPGMTQSLPADARNARGLAAHDAVDAVALAIEVDHDRAQQFAAARQLDAHRVDEAAVDADFVVQVRAGGETGRADEADHLALTDAGALIDATSISRHVAVRGLVTIGVTDQDKLAVAGFPANPVDHAVA